MKKQFKYLFIIFAIIGFVISFGTFSANAQSTQTIYYDWHVYSQEVVELPTQSEVVEVRDRNGDGTLDYYYQDRTETQRINKERRLVEVRDSVNGTLYNSYYEYRDMFANSNTYINYRWVDGYYKTVRSSQSQQVDAFVERYLIERRDINGNGILDERWEDRYYKVMEYTTLDKKYKVENNVQTSLVNTTIVSKTYNTIFDKVNTYWIYR